MWPYHQIFKTQAKMPRNCPLVREVQRLLTLPSRVQRALRTEQPLYFQISIIYTVKQVFDRILVVLIGF